MSEMLCDCVPGDVVAITWSDPTSHMHGTRQLVLFCAARGGHGKKKSDPHSAIVELVDPDTLEPYAMDSFELRDRSENMFVHANVEVLDLVRRSHHMKLDRDAELRVDKLGDADDPLKQR